MPFAFGKLLLPATTVAVPAVTAAVVYFQKQNTSLQTGTIVPPENKIATIVPAENTPKQPADKQTNPDPQPVIPNEQDALKVDGNPDESTSTSTSTNTLPNPPNDPANDSLTSSSQTDISQPPTPLSPSTKADPNSNTSNSTATGAQPTVTKEQMTKLLNNPEHVTKLIEAFTQQKTQCSAQTPPANCEKIDTILTALQKHQPKPQSPTPS